MSIAIAVLFTILGVFLLCAFASSIWLDYRTGGFSNLSVWAFWVLFGVPLTLFSEALVGLIVLFLLGVLPW